MSVLDKMNQRGTVITPATIGIDDGVNTNLETIMDDGLPTHEEYDEAIMALESIHSVLCKMSTNAGTISQRFIDASREAYKGICLAVPKLQLESMFFNPFIGANYEQNVTACELTKTMLRNTVSSLKDKRGQLC